MTCYFDCRRELMRVCCDSCGDVKHVFRPGTIAGTEAPKWYRDGKAPPGWLRVETKDYCPGCKRTVGTLDERVKRIIAQQLGVELERVVDAAILEALGADSLAVVEIVIHLESVFDCDIPDEDSRALRTVKDCIDVARRWGVNRGKDD